MLDPNQSNLAVSIPDFSQAAFIAPSASVMGQVAIATGASIWYSAVVRGDVEKIEIGAYSNVQDGAVLHGDPGQITFLGSMSPSAIERSFMGRILKKAV